MGAESRIAEAIHKDCAKKDHGSKTHLPTALHVLTLATRHLSVTTITNCAQHMARIEDLERRLAAALHEVANLHSRLDTSESRRLQLARELQAAK